MPLKVLVFADKFLPREQWEMAFKEKMGEEYKKVEFTFYDLEEDDPSWIGRPSYKGVKEFFGNPLMIAKQAEKFDVLIVQFAPVTEEVYETAKNLKLVACNRSTPVNVDVEGASKRKIPIINTPGRNADSVADFTMGLILCEVRHIARAFEAVRNGTYLESSKRWRKSIPELKDKTIGIVGFGKIGTKVAERAKGFSMKVLAYDPFVSEEKIRQYGGEKVGLDELLTKSDFVTIHMRLTPQTTKMIGKREISLMKKTAFLINTSRGEVIDEDALYEALVDKSIAGAALDVFVKEPIYSDPNNRFLHLDNITFTPHLAGPSDDMFYRGACMIAEDLARFLRGERMENVMNRDALKQS